MSHIHTAGRLEGVRFGHTWRDDSGVPHATVDFGVSWIEFSSAADAEQFANACIAARDAIGALPPAATEAGA